MNFTRAKNQESKAMKNTVFSTIFLGAMVLSLSVISVTLMRESRWNRLIMASLVTKFDDQEFISPKEKDMLATVTFSKLGMKENRSERKKRRSTLKNESRDEKKNIHAKVEGSIEHIRATNATDALASKLPTHCSVSWLVSFPNSGTTYTIHNTEQVSMRSTATNYAMELHYKDEMLPVCQNKDNIAHGPWQRNNTLRVPPTILTKTHCAGYSDRAALQNSIVSTERFLSGCQESTQYIDPNNRSNHVKKQSSYEHKDLVKSVIHLIRNPFDNVISRMHHGMKMRQKRLGFSAEQIRRFMESRMGVMTWCTISDKSFWREKQIPTKITNKNKLRRIPFDADLLLKVPCHSEFFRYVEWHNAAIRMIKQERLPSMIVYYEDYETNYNRTVDSILDFLDLSREAPPLPFKTGKTYRDMFFDAKTQKATKELLKAMASEELWEILREYFPSSSSSNSSAAFDSN